MSKGIRVSEKHGVNPSLGVCFWCGEENGEIVLLGKLKGDAEAPHRVVTNYEPCDKCKEMMSQGITLIQAVQHPIDNVPEMQKGVWPTGKWCVVKEEAFAKAFEDSDFAKAVIEKRKGFVDPETWTKLGLE